VVRRQWSCTKTPAKGVTDKVNMTSLPTEFELDGRRFVQAWRSTNVAVFLCDGAGYFAWATRVVAGQERRAELIKTSPLLRDCVGAATAWEAR
jgi:hypothetical protein